MENYCKNCGAHIKDDARFCQECGKEVENVQNTCPNCGEKIDKNDIFCPECGTKVNENICPNCGKSIEGSENFCENCRTKLNAPKVVKKNNFIERNKIPLIIGVTVLIVAIIILVTISLTPVEEEVGTQIASVGAHEFEISGDYVISPSTIDVDYTGYSAIFSQGYSNDDGEAIYISVMTIPYGVDGDSVASSEGGVQKNLMGVNGYYNEEDISVYTFAFVDGTYLNVVSVTSPYILDEITYLG